ncbi:MAG: serine/threonine-protein kinase [Woeseiaceae bacterium]|nr:serine/threonine-protein kinase [Woeseiaceae bacterium]
MDIRVLISDGQAAFRTLLMHHVSTHWPGAVITEYDPEANGHLSDGFAGAGNDLVLLGDRQGDRDPLAMLRQFRNNPGFPPIIFFGNADARAAAERAGADSFLARDRVRHDSLVVCMSDLLKERRNLSSTNSLFVGDLRTGVHPLIKGYELERRLSANEHSGVYLARKAGTDREVVLKVLRHDPERDDGLGAFDRFLREYELIADLQHPNIVRIFDLGVSDDHAHIAMEYLSGGDLKKRIDRGIRPEQAVDYARQIASALARIHEVGILHRDLKPANIMLRSDGSLALIDFGLAKHMRLQQAITDSGEIFGTPYYMSPEQGRGNAIDHRSDIYSLGVIFYEMLTGDKPYRASNAMGIIFKHSEAPIPLLAGPLAEYQAALNLMLAKKPEDRLQSADEVLEWL